MAEVFSLIAGRPIVRQLTWYHKCNDQCLVGHAKC